MSTIVENKWDTNQIQALPTQDQPKVLRKILEKTFITKTYTQYKTSYTLKIAVFELLDKKNIGNFFSKYETFPGLI